MMHRPARPCSPARWLAALGWLAAFAGAGPGAPAGPPAPSLSIGLALEDSGAGAAAAEEIRRGAEIALLESEGSAGEAPVPFHAASRAGAWSAGAGELVRLIYELRAGAILGPAEGRAAHLAEQVAARAKGQALVLTPWATDPSLTRAGVPWFFRLVHDDRRQAAALLGVIVDERRLRRLLLVAGGPDPAWSRAAGVFEEAAAGRGVVELRRVVLDAEGRGERPLADESREFGAEAAIFLLPPAAAARAARILRDSGSAAAFFGPLELSSPDFLEAAGGAAEGMVLSAPAWPRGSRADRFRASYRERHGREPGVPAACGYDGAGLLADALRRISRRGIPQRPGEALRRDLETIRWEGLTGTITFDAAGNRDGPVPLARVENGRLRPITSSGPDAPR